MYGKLLITMYHFITKKPDVYFLKNKAIISLYFSFIKILSIKPHASNNPFMTAPASIETWVDITNAQRD